MAESERRRVTLTDIAFGGDCLARIDNQVIFASFGLPGEEVIVELSQGKKDYRRGRVVGVVSPSRARIQPLCPLFSRCGGCQWQHIDYPTQLEMKRKVVADQLRRIGGFSDDIHVNPTLGADHPWHYRNHGRFSVHDGRLGFLEENSHRFLTVDTCHLMHPVIDQALASLQGKLPVSLSQLTVRYGVNTGQLLIDPPPRIDDLALPSSHDFIEEAVLGRRFRLAAGSFFQVNTMQAERMIAYAVESLAPGHADVVLDLYCGVGTFGLLVADKVARVIGVEYSATALRDAGFNARGMRNIEFVRGAAEDVLPNLRERIDVAIVDPPRAGCRPQVVDALQRLRPSKIIYASCDPATLARDLKLLCAEHYAILDVQPVDMFPQTYHIETVVTLSSR